jgi:hypothetical protein
MPAGPGVGHAPAPRTLTIVELASKKHLRNWAAGGFEGSPFDKKNSPDSRTSHHAKPTGGRAPAQSALETKENLEEDGYEGGDDTGVVAPEVLEDNIMHAIGGMNENARISAGTFTR